MVVAKDRIEEDLSVSEQFYAKYKAILDFTRDNIDGAKQCFNSALVSLC